MKIDKNKIRDLFRVKLYLIRSKTKKREREREREKKRKKEKKCARKRENRERDFINPNTYRGIISDPN